MTESFEDDQHEVDTLDQEPIGYRSPPRRSRFPKGRSGNPRGRPKKRLGLADALERVLKTKVINPQTGKKVTLFEALTLKCREYALSGDQRAIKIFNQLTVETSRFVPTFNASAVVQVDTTAAKQRLAEILGLTLADVADKEQNDEEA